MKNWFIILEDKLINFLTTICWWLDLHFDIKSKQVADASFLLLFNFLSYFYSDFQNHFNLVAILISNIIFSFFCLYIFKIMPLFKEVYKNSILNPNPNRYSLAKIAVYSAVIIIPLIIRDPQGTVYPTGLFFLYYILCSEPMPPAEKVKRKERNEMSKMKFSESS